MRSFARIVNLVLLLVCVSTSAYADLINWPSLFSTSNLPNWANPKNWPFTLIPIPEISTDPNSGTTYGILPVFLFTNEHNEISQILAPDVANNTILGATGNFRYLSYPSSDTQYYVIAGASQKIARKVDLFYSTGRDRKKLFSFDGRLFFERDPTERFFGIGNNSDFGHQTNYTTEQLYFEGRAGLNFGEELQLALVTRPRFVRILPGALDNLPYIGTAFPLVKGINGGSEWLNRVELTYDNRDSVDIPRRGGEYCLFYGLVDRRLGSSVSYNQMGFDARHYLPLSSRFTLAGHFYIQYTPAGIETPFWSMPRLGGEESLLANQETLRGYGTGRFLDNNLDVANIELRTRVYERDVFGTHGILELAPFLEAGKVFHTPRDNPLNQMHPVGGMGFRAIAQPFVVGFVDVGWGGEGAAIFSGINYPF